MILLWGTRGLKMEKPSAKKQLAKKKQEKGKGDLLCETRAVFS
jgi:hypothetical protein